MGPPPIPPGGTLILGGTGFLGVHAIEAALRAVEAGRLPGPVVFTGREERAAATAAVREPLERAGALWHPVAGASGQPTMLRWALFAMAEWAPARVLLLSAMSRVGECDRNPPDAFRLNAALPQFLAGASRTSGSRLVHVSTDLVLEGAAPEGGYREEAIPSPLGVYGRSKYEGEQSAARENPDALVVRLPLLYGDSRGRGLGATDGLLAALEGDGRVVLFEDEWRTPLEVSNAAEALVELLAGEERGLLHVAGPERVSRAELGRRGLAAAARAGRAPAREPEFGLRADVGQGDRPADCSLDASRARALLRTELLGVDAGLARAFPPAG